MWGKAEETESLDSMNFIVLGNDTVLIKLLQERFEYNSNVLCLGCSLNDVLVVQGSDSEMMRCIKNEYSDSPQTLVWQTPSIRTTAAAFLLSWAERFSRQGRNLIIHVPESIPINAALSSRFRIRSMARKAGSKGYRLSSRWLKQRDDFVSTFFHRSKVE